MLRVPQEDGYVFQGKPQFSEYDDLLYTPERLLIVYPVGVILPMYGFDQAQLFVMPKHPWGDAIHPGNLADGKEVIIRLFHGCSPFLTLSIKDNTVSESRRNFSCRVINLSLKQYLI